VRIIYSERCLGFGEPGHPESPERVRHAAGYLRRRYEFTTPEPATERDLALVHTQGLIERVRTRSFFDFDCPRYHDIYDYSLLAVGGSIHAAQVGGFSLLRPPGHHAGKGFLGGFCYFNNIAVAVKKSGLRTLIVDIDAHHGNGTQDIFLGDPQVPYLSLHRSPFYPGTGLKSERNCLNYPLPGYCGPAVYLPTLAEALEVAKGVGEFEQVAISVGLDGYERDPLASLGLPTSTYHEIGELISGLGLPVFAVLEGGYVPKATGPNIEALIRGLSS
jgi:acetoin utilization deacetylase AcuC-like enzyme